ncbi:MAG TPA: hypothetical protein VIY48_10160 [Candidatus Paceibacterota bacterium]
MAFNYSFNFTDAATNGDGTGPYTVTALKNPTAATGGTTIYSNTNANSNFNILELAKQAVLAAVNTNANQNQNDSLN